METVRGMWTERLGMQNQRINQETAWQTLGAKRKENYAANALSARNLISNVVEYWVLVNLNGM